MTEQSELVVLWTSGDKEVAENMVFMYTLNSAVNDWWEDVRLLVWGASTGLLRDDRDLQYWIDQLHDAGVHVEACKSCAENYGAVEALEDLDIEVYYIGETLTTYFKDDDRYVMTV
ncbi:DsrE/DsrF-like family [Halanaeroarchaeum sp. HSR-CO]|uniref:DsrE family protein n=1 Tax=Halanaeroarchaeum sp. HSR-CO TaxID=2866382 RepID=UPI00217EC37E|nr:DsrE family protein [Halanaeroarchaeum sp. HSR-CO]UWG48516.1 DsrE/DsrF-like family [Halanaeroarchaeum sp. HSR-CO]